MAGRVDWPMTGWAAATSAVRFHRDPLGFLTDASTRWGSLYSFGLPQWLPGRKRKIIFAISEENHRRVLREDSEFRGSSVGLKGPSGSALNRLRTGFSPRKSLDRKAVDHAALRKLVWSAFSRRTVEASAGEITAIAAEIIDRWSECSLINVWHEMRAISLRVSCRLLFGGQSPESGFALGEALQEFIQCSYFSAAYLLQRDWPGTPYRRLLRTSERVTAGIDALVAQRQSSPASGADVLAMMVRGCEQAGVRPDLAGPAAFLFVASFETVANALSWTLLLLAQHPTVMSDLHDELKSAVSGGEPQVEQVSDLPLLDAVLKESMRLFPPVPMVYRTASRATELGDRPVAVGDWVICSPYVTQRNADAFPAPQRFLPERWFGAVANPYVYFPYGVGSHSCVGQHLGNTILKLCLTLIAQRWRLTLAPGARIDRSVAITLTPRRGIPMRVWGQNARYRAVPFHGNVRDMVEFEELSSAPHILPLPALGDRKKKRRVA